MAVRRMNKPPFAAWLVEQRERAGLKAEEVARRLREAGLQAEDSTYRVWESNSDRRPAPDTVAALERMFLSAAPAEDLALGADVAAAIDRQTAMLSRLLEELTAGRLDRERLERLSATVDQLVAADLARAGSQGQGTLDAPPVTAE